MEKRSSAASWGPLLAMRYFGIFCFCSSFYSTDFADWLRRTDAREQGRYRSMGNMVLAV